MELECTFNTYASSTYNATKYSRKLQESKVRNRFIVQLNIVRVVSRD